MRLVLLGWLILVSWVTLYAQTPVRELPQGLVVLPLVIDQELAEAMEWMPGDNIWLEVHILKSPNGELLYEETAEKVWWLGEMAIVMLGASGEQLPAKILGRGMSWIRLSEAGQALSDEPIVVYPRKQAMRFSADENQIRAKLSGALPGVDASYLSQVANFLAGNLMNLDVTGTSYSISGVGEVINSAGEWTGSNLPANQNLFESINADTGSTTADSTTDSLTVNGGGIVSTQVTGDVLAITATEVDGDSSNELQNLFQTVSGNAGSTSANSQTDQLSIVGSGSVSTAVAGDTLTITGTGITTEVDGSTTNELQNLFQNVVANSGSTTADTHSDTLTFSGTTGINTQVSGDSVLIGVGANSLDFSQLTNTMTLDATTTLDMDSQNADLNIDNQTLYVSALENRIGLGTQTPQEKLHLEGGNFLQTAGDFQQVSALNIGDNPLWIHVNGCYAYVIDNLSTDLKIIDVSDASTPRLLSSTSIDTSPTEVYVAGSYAYIADRSSDDLQILDISNPGAPFEVGRVDIGSNPSNVRVSGTYAYLINDTPSSDFFTVDVSNPAAPKIVAQVALGGFNQGLFVLGKYAYTGSSGNDELEIIDISNPHAPEVVGNFGSLDPNAIYARGSHVFLLDSISNQLIILDVSDPTAPSQLGSIASGPNSIALHVSGRYVYVLDGDNEEILAIDVSNPASPELVTTFALGGNSDNFVVAGRYAIVTLSADPGFRVIDLMGADVVSANVHELTAGNAQVKNDLKVGGQLSVSSGLNLGKGGLFSDGDIGVSGNVSQSPKNPSLVGSVGLGGSPQAVRVAGSYAYVLDSGSDDLRVIDITNPANPVQISNLVIGNLPDEVALSGRYAYVTIRSTGLLLVIDISDPHQPTLVGTATTGSNPQDISVNGRYAYITDDSANDLRIFDISDPVAPVQVGSLGLGSRPVEIEVIGRYAYVIDWDADDIKVIDVSDPASPSLQGSVGVGPGPFGLDVSGRYAYVTDINSNDIKVVDVSNPSLPVVVTSLALGGGSRRVSVTGSYAYVVNSGSSLLQTIDISDPSNPVIVGARSVGGGAPGFDVSGRLGYLVEAGSNALQIYNLTGGSMNTFEAGSIAAGRLTIRDDIRTRGRLDVGDSINIGPGGLLSDGDVGLKGSLAITNDLVPSASLTNGVLLYSEDSAASSELKVRDEAGNITTLSPHNFSLIGQRSEPLAWSYYSENQHGKINVDMLRTVRLVEQLSGETLVHVDAQNRLDQELSTKPIGIFDQLKQENEALKARLAKQQADFARENEALRHAIQEIQLALGQKQKTTSSSSNHQAQQKNSSKNNR